MRSKFKNAYHLFLMQVRESRTGKLLTGFATVLHRVFLSSRILNWFTSSNPCKEDNFFSRFFENFERCKFADFLRSGFIFKGIVHTSDFAWRIPMWCYGNFVGCLGLGLFLAGKSKWFLLLSLLGIFLQWNEKDLRAFCKSVYFLHKLPAFLEAPTDDKLTFHKKYYYSVASSLGLLIGIASHFVGCKLALVGAAALLLLPFLLGSPFTCLTVSVWGAMCLPTLLVMLLSLLTVALTLIHWLYGKEKMPRFSASAVWWFLLCLVTLVYTCFGLGGTNGFLAGGIRLAMMPALFSAWVLLRSKERIIKFCLSLVGGGSVVGLYGLYQYLTGGASAKWTDTELFGRYFGRIVATFENPNIYGEFLLILLPLCAALFLLSSRKLVKAFSLGSALLLAINLALTYSRGCYVALALAVVVMLWFIDKRWLIPLEFLLLLSPLYLPDSIMTRLQSIGNMSDTSTLYRVQIWQGTLMMLRQYWWIGAGFGSVAFSALYDRFALEAVDAPHAHNLLLQTMSETGIVGAICTVCLLLFICRDALCSLHTLADKGLKMVQIALFSAWCALALQGIFDYTFYNNNLFLIMMCSLGVMLSIGRKEFQEDEQ